MGCDLRPETSAEHFAGAECGRVHIQECGPGDLLNLLCDTQGHAPGAARDKSKPMCRRPRRHAARGARRGDCGGRCGGALQGATGGRCIGEEGLFVSARQGPDAAHRRPFREVELCEELQGNGALADEEGAPGPRACAEGEPRRALDRFRRDRRLLRSNVRLGRRIVVTPAREATNRPESQGVLDNCQAVGADAPRGRRRSLMATH
mmetsp:Transcript_66025/g.190471  ORF Transcript_66025/g.190471 Transcript_66025/m.190471 type:complete len:206 (-) Transcript_66025:1070-1687(-)